MDISLQKDEITCELEEAGDNSVDLHITVSADAVKREMDKTFDRLKENVNVPGFRTGKVPVSVIKKKYGQVVQDDLLQQILQDSLEIAISDQEIEAVGEPEFNERPEKLEEGEALEYSVNIETMPEIKVGEYDDIEVEKSPVEVTEDEMESALEEVRKEHAELNWIEDGEVQEDDILVTDVTLEIDDEEVASDENVELQANENIRIFNVHHPELVDKLIGLRSGDTHRVDFEMPEDAEPEEFQGKTATVELEIHEIKRLQLPELNDDFAETYGVEDVETLKEQVREEVRSAKEQQEEEAVQEEIIDNLIEQAGFKVPQRLLDQGTEEFLRRQQMRMARAGVPQSVVQDKIDEHREESRESIERFLKRKYLLDEIADREKIFVTEDEVEEYISHLASEQDMWPHELEEELEERNQMDQLRSELKERKVLNFLMEQVTIKEQE